MEKKLGTIKSVYARKDIDGTVLGFTVGVVLDGSKDYVNRFDFGPSSFSKTFGFDGVKEESRLNGLVGQHCYLTSSLTLS